MKFINGGRPRRSVSEAAIEQRASGWGCRRDVPGTIIEREIFGLPADAVRQLMKECGTVVDATTSDTVAAQPSGNPTAIRMLCAMTGQHYLDPLAALGVLVDPKAPFASLLGRAVADLHDAATSILRRISLLRRPMAWNWLSAAGLDAPMSSRCPTTRCCGYP